MVKFGLTKSGIAKLVSEASLLPPPLRHSLPPFSVSPSPPPSLPPPPPCPLRPPSPSPHPPLALPAVSTPSAAAPPARGRLAPPRGGAYRVSGQKKWITGGHVADFLTLAVRTGAGSKGISLLLADTSAPGIEIRKMETQFDTCHGTTFITLDNVLIPEENLIGKEGAGFNYLLLNFNHERLVISVSTCRFARLCYTEALRYSMRRKTFGKPLSEHQMIRWKLAEMLRQVEALHDYNERVAFQYKAGVPDSRLGSQCALLKVQASKTFEYCAREASQVFGGASVVREGPGRVVERLYREVRAQAIPGGSEEILLDLAARQAIASAVKAPAAAGKSRL
ncbi:unnamed protein product [Prorocentrum cordatum]|uniref:Acyl-CoA dehydrogenase/oxidase C-terminal domain-containing protein n=1 Tax=Prorocentrum cordatum TaxID=2364126 RepID=A0ABN9PAF1_9DINO|nr:unnamed protein product [Polarella glacialis]